MSPTVENTLGCNCGDGTKASRSAQWLHIVGTKRELKE